MTQMLMFLVRDGVPLFFSPKATIEMLRCSLVMLGPSLQGPSIM